MGQISPDHIEYQVVTGGGAPPEQLPGVWVRLGISRGELGEDGQMGVLEGYQHMTCAGPHALHQHMVDGCGGRDTLDHSEVGGAVGSQ